MEKLKKENAKEEFMIMIKNSWTWRRLTEDEKQRFENTLNMSRFEKTIVGSYAQRYKILNNFYFMFLEGVGYTPTNWREPKEVK